MAEEDIIEYGKIPLQLLLLREALEDEDLTIGEYVDGTRSTNYAAISYFLCPGRDSNNFDFLRAVEETLHELLAHGFNEDDIRSIMGLYDDVEEQNQADFEEKYTSIDLGWYLPNEIWGIELANPQRCTEALHDKVSERQIEQACIALNEDGIGIHAAMSLFEYEYTDWQAFAICKAYRDDVDETSIKEISNPKFNHSQMRELSRIAKDSPGNPKYGISPYLKDCLETAFSPEKMRQMRLLGEEIGKGKRVLGSFTWGGINAPQLDAQQISNARYAVMLGIPIETIATYATGEYSAEQMAVLTLALHDGFEQKDMERLMRPYDQLNPISSLLPADRMNEVYRFTEFYKSGRITEAELDYLCDLSIIPNTRTGIVLSIEQVDAVFQGLLNNLDLDLVAAYADGSFSSKQMEVIFGCASTLLNAGKESKEIESDLRFLADPNLTPKQMQQLAAEMKYGKDASELADAKENMLRSSPAEKSARGRQQQSMLGAQAKESRVAAGKLVTQHDAIHDEISQEKE